MKSGENVIYFEKSGKVRLSVIVPMYNAEKWIERCMESILGQTFHDYEVIIVNDGSTDNSLNNVKNYCRENKQIRCVSTKNQGSARAKNTGLKYISGDLVTFVDADDFIENIMYETMISTLDSYNADIVECACQKINKYGRELWNIDLVNEEINGNEQCILHFMKQKNTKNYMCNKIYKRELFEGVQFPVLCFSEDYYMNAVLHSKISKKVVISQAFYKYMIYSGQSTDIRCLSVKRIDGIKAGNMVADFFSYDKRLKNYASLYACNYALFIMNIVYGRKYKTVKEIIKHMRPELFKSLSHISFNMLHDIREKKVVFQCFLILISHSLFFDFRWLFE